MVGIISFSIGMFVGFCLCALLSASKINGEVYFIDLSDGDIVNDNKKNNEGGSNEEI